MTQTDSITVSRNVLIYNLISIAQLIFFNTFDNLLLKTMKTKNSLHTLWS